MTFVENLEASLEPVIHLVCSQRHFYVFISTDAHIHVLSRSSSLVCLSICTCVGPCRLQHMGWRKDTFQELLLSYRVGFRD